ncbi:(d)CMP kinase [Vallitalea okinawensis]|uniref:(d)CMP kinase n=1 Tax=Vallitalea okinawensis TaxID=2078660 RepID=UPI000CFC3F6D|nr:(d)CMP kinase [Vallitalea okinawensis]
MNYISIAIDGPAGAGKSTIAKNVANVLGINYVDTGSMYRTIAYYCLQNNIAFDDQEKVIASLNQINIQVKYIKGEQRMFLCDEDVTDRIRSQEVGNGASAVGVYKEVRTKLVALQQDIAKSNSVVMDGRDIGTFVIPKADLKIYLTASVKKRAERRYAELIAKGLQANLQQIEREIEERDYRDMNREYAPLVKAEDAVELDTTFLDIDDVTNKVIDLYRR